MRNFISRLGILALLLAFVGCESEPPPVQAPAGDAGKAQIPEGLEPASTKAGK